MSHTHKLIDRENLEFLLRDVLEAEGLLKLPDFEDHDLEAFFSMLDQAYRLADTEFGPLQRAMDDQEPWLGETGEVKTFPGLKPVLSRFYELGFSRLSFREAVGGFQMPVLLSQALMSVFYSANISAIAYPVLTLAAARVLQSFGTEEQCRKYLEPMLEGRFYGTMALTEPQAGSSLADICTKATPDGEGAYHIQGSKIFISGGDQDLSENIVHLVLAHEEGLEAGIAGLALFIVPKFLVEGDGQLGGANGVSLTGLIHKMGYRGTTSTLLSFGDQTPCRGYRIGDAGRGLFYMFQMMNEARIVVGTGAASLACSSFSLARSYAEERLQGRAFSSRGSEIPQVPLISHPVVKADLIKQKAYAEGAFCLCLYGAGLVDRSEYGSDPAQQEQSRELLDLLTPVIKSWPSKYGLEVNDMALQLHGGYGYTRDFQVEQLYRDNRLNPIHEGTHTIQSFDLAFRKLGQKGGEAIRILLDEMEKDLERLVVIEPAAKEQAEKLEEGFHNLLRRWNELSGTQDTASLSVFAPEFLDLFGHHIIGWMWVRQWIAASGISRSSYSPDFLAEKKTAAHWFLAQEIPTLSGRIQGLGQYEAALLENCFVS